MSRVLVTGGAGYVGSRLIRDMARDPALRGWTIRLIDNLQRETFGALMDLPADGSYEFVEGDILDPAAMAMALDGVDAVVHLAALVRTPFSSDQPTWTEHVNHWGTARLIEDCLDRGVSRFVFTSSAGVYGPGGPFSEDDAPKPIGAYSRSKLRAEHAVQSAGERGLEWTVLRLGTVYGHAAAIRFDAMPNRLAYLLATGQLLLVHGSGEQERPLLHVADASSAIRFCLTPGADTRWQVINVVGENVSVAQVVEALRSGRRASDVRYTDQDELTRFSLALDGSKFEDIGWRPGEDLQRGLAEVAYHIGPFEVRRQLDLVSS